MRPMLYETGLRPHHETYPWIHVIFMIMAVIFWGVVIYGLVLFINKYAKNHDTKDTAEDALSIAKTRYARGEISKAEFTELKKALSES